MKRYHIAYGMIYLICLCFLLTGCNVEEGNDYTPAPTGATHPIPSVTEKTGGPSATENYDPEFVFQDIKLEEVVRSILQKQIGPIFLSDVQRITVLNARVYGIRSIEDLKYFSSLEELDLYGNHINSIAPLSSLTHLRRLNVARNYHVLNASSGSSSDSGLDLRPLMGLTRLEDLNLERNSISDITPLSSLHSLTTLNLANNRITDISPLKDCIKLEYVWLNDNLYTDFSVSKDRAITDLSPAALWEKCKILDVSGNLVNDLTPLETLVQLNAFYADRNSIVKLTPLENLIHLNVLSVGYNYISDFSPILTMQGLQQLIYEGNAINDMSPIQTFLEGNI